ncbi:type III-B CRISPR module RAMP protein Cmr1 [Candidatus Chloroploca sp. Khr17]|uniref:type III-B CRISPR module RAMP protein Cmr1 n=1 Tax=Candidatus Chloroploca sp. Khr17 TaxID=2496869 RepID=UPI00101D8FE8|nr:type III-B CRISPR module RAMP protein Cmr1 [Candidatus Chloroploca sp. Khr17]
MRTPPPDAPANISKKATPDLVTQVRAYRLLTPLFGGGAIPQQADEVTVVRGTEVRGHLRFWWRATRGGQANGDLKRLKEAEDRLWGAPSDPAKRSGPSKIQVVVEPTSRGEVFQVKDGRGQSVAVGHFRSPYSYVAFPLQQTEGTVRANVGFTLTITYAAQDAADVEAALWAWETFGGLGARTRRGFGALQRVDQPGAPAGDLLALVRQGLKDHVVNGTWPSHVPHLTPTMPIVVTRSYQDSLAAWRFLFERLKEFRQARTKRLGRSNWPEPEAIRNLTGYRSKAHQPMPTSGKFPRAAFGLPIIFQFKRDDQREGDPRGNNTLLGETKDGQIRDRLASPLILRPLADGGAAYGLAAVLQGVALPDRLIIKYGQRLRNGRDHDQVDAILTPDEARELRGPNNQGTLLGPETDVVQAFLTFLERNNNA